MTSFWFSGKLLTVERGNKRKTKKLMTALKRWRSGKRYLAKLNLLAKVQPTAEQLKPLQVMEEIGNGITSQLEYKDGTVYGAKYHNVFNIGQVDMTDLAAENAVQFKIGKGLAESGEVEPSEVRTTLAQTMLKTNPFESMVTI